MTSIIIRRPDTQAVWGVMDVNRFDHQGLRQLQNIFVSDEDLRGRNILHASYCPAMCSLKNQSLPLSTP